MKKLTNFLIFLVIAGGVFIGYKWLKGSGNIIRSEGKTYAVVVGISNYKLAGQPNQITNLNFCDDDANLFYSFLKSSAGGSVPESNIALLIDNNASKANILDQMDKMFARSGPNDRVIFYFAGHGNNGYFIPYDMDTYKSNSNLFHKEVKEAFRKCRAKTRLCFADACRSGSMKYREEEASASPQRSAPEVRSFEDSEAGLVVLMATRPYQNAGENTNIIHGYFTKFLVDGLQGKADKNTDQIVTIKEAYDYLFLNLAEISKGKPVEKAQAPVIFGDYDENMPIANLKSA
jgi:hypothetical protein